MGEGGFLGVALCCIADAEDEILVTWILNIHTCDSKSFQP